MSRPDHAAAKEYAEDWKHLVTEANLMLGTKSLGNLARAYLQLSRRVEEVITRMNRENVDRAPEPVPVERKRLYTLLSDIREIATGVSAALSEASQNE